MVVPLAIGITITFSKMSLTGTCFDRKICYWLGNFSLTLYLNHITIRKMVQKMNFGLSHMQTWLVFVFAALVWSLVAHVFVWWLLKRREKRIKMM